MQDAGLSGFALIKSYLFNVMQSAGVLIIITRVGILTSIKEVVHSHFLSDFWNWCYLSADLWQSNLFSNLVVPLLIPLLLDHVIPFGKKMFLRSFQWLFSQ
jgi:hypothetical protein